MLLRPYSRRHPPLPPVSRRRHKRTHVRPRMRQPHVRPGRKALEGNAALMTTTRSAHRRHWHPHGTSPLPTHTGARARSRALTRGAAGRRRFCRRFAGGKGTGRAVAATPKVRFTTHPPTPARARPHALMLGAAGGRAGGSRAHSHLHPQGTPPQNREHTGARPHD